MSLQDKMLIKNKEGVSEMVGYVLLVVFAVIIAAIIFAWLRTYVPAEALNCPDGVSVFINEASFDNSTWKLNLSIRNNGRFDIAGYFIHATNNSSQEVPTIDLSPYLNQNFSGIKFGNSVILGQVGNISFAQGGNLFKTGEQRRNIFDIPPGVGEPYSIRIIPIRFQEEDNRQRFVSCGNAKVQQLVGGLLCIPSTCSSLNYSCGTWYDGCGSQIDCGTCSGTNVCGASGQCIPPAQCTDTCATYGYQCGTWLICSVSTPCGTCSPGFSCNLQGQCISNCGNGVIDTGETCDDGNTNNGDGCSSTCTVENGFTCVGQPSQCTAIASCPSYCISLAYSTGSCRSSPGNCGANNGTYQSGGDQWCTGGSNADTCCCGI